MDAVNTAGDAYRNIPPVTRVYSTIATVTTVACNVGIIAPYTLHFSSTAILSGQLWRFLTCFLYFGKFGLEPLIQMYFLVRYCGTLEKEEFGGRKADFIWVLLVAGTLLLSLSFVTEYAFESTLPWLGSAVVSMTVYIWSYRNPKARLNWFGFNFWAPYFPWVLLGFGLLMGNSILDELFGIAVGHICFFLEFVLPRMKGVTYLRAPKFVKQLIN